MTIITRSALVFHGHNPAPEVARIEIDPFHGRRVVTWEDVMRDRRQRQADRLRQKRAVEPKRAVRLWVAYFDQDLFGGWHAFIDDFRGRDNSDWVNRGRVGKFHPTIQRLYELFPLTLPLGRDANERFTDWMIAFAKTYRRGTQDGRPRGCAYLWRCGRELGPVIPPFGPNSQKRSRFHRNSLPPGPSIADPPAESIRQPIGDIHSTTFAPDPEELTPP